MRKITFFMLVGFLCAMPVASGNIKVGDTLQITIKGVPLGEKGKIDGQYVVGQSGTIRLPIVDASLGARGLSPELLARKIEKAYRDSEIYTAPTIEVISNAAPRPAGAVVSIGGQVKSSGPVAFQPGMTLLQVVQAAGDLTMFGTKKRLYLTRESKRYVLDLRKIEHQNYPVKADDTIVVDQRGPFDGE